MAFPFRDINVQASPDCYIFKSPSTPNALALTIDRPTGEIRLNDAALLSGKRVTRVFSIKGILGVIQLRLGTFSLLLPFSFPLLLSCSSSPQPSRGQLSNIRPPR